MVENIEKPRLAAGGPAAAAGSQTFSTSANLLFSNLVHFSEGRKNMFFEIPLRGGSRAGIWTLHLPINGGSRAMFSYPEHPSPQSLTLCPGALQSPGRQWLTNWLINHCFGGWL